MVKHGTMLCGARRRCLACASTATMTWVNTLDFVHQFAEVICVTPEGGYHVSAESSTQPRSSMHMLCRPTQMTHTFS